MRLHRRRHTCDVTRHETNGKKSLRGVRIDRTDRARRQHETISKIRWYIHFHRVTNSTIYHLGDFDHKSFTLTSLFSIIITHHNWCV